jgi:uncharacterized protein (TIGR00255 family)
MHMVYSMTGFANETLKLPQGEISWELRSVNHRYLEAQFRLPEPFRGLEQTLREQVTHSVKRGKLDLTLQFRPAQGALGGLKVNADLASRVVAAAKHLQTELGEGSQIDPLDVLRWPGVVAEQRPDTEQLAEPVHQLLGSALEALQATRGREGERIEVMLSTRLEKIGAAVADVRARLPEVMHSIKERVLERAQSLEVRVDNDRLEQELVMLAQKLDVAEELDRLDAHIAETRAALKTTQPIGRRLDFLMQEFNREANTLASKSADAATSTIAVDLKVLIEQMREQVQNVE